MEIKCIYCESEKCGMICTGNGYACTKCLLDRVDNLEKELADLKDKYRWRDAINEPPKHEESIILMSIGYEEVGSYCLDTKTFYINGEAMPHGDVSHWTEFTEFEEDNNGQR